MTNAYTEQKEEMVTHVSNQQRGFPYITSSQPSVCKDEITVSAAARDNGAVYARLGGQKVNGASRTSRLTEVSTNSMLCELL